MCSYVVLHSKSDDIFDLRTVWKRSGRKENAQPLLSEIICNLKIKLIIFWFIISFFFLDPSALVYKHVNSEFPGALWPYQYYQAELTDNQNKHPSGRIYNKKVYQWAVITHFDPPPAPYTCECVARQTLYSANSRQFTRSFDRAAPLAAEYQGRSNIVAQKCNFDVCALCFSGVGEGRGGLIRTDGVFFFVLNEAEITSQ